MSEDYYTKIYYNVFGNPNLDNTDEYIHNMEIITTAANIILNYKSSVEVLKALYESDGLHDGDISSKYGRDILLNYDFACKCIKKGEWGFQVCTYKGAWALKVIDWIETDAMNS